MQTESKCVNYIGFELLGKKHIENKSVEYNIMLTKSPRYSGLSD